MNIRKIIREEIQKIFEDYRYQYDTDTYTPSSDVVRAAQEALNATSNNNMVSSESPNEGSGLSKAKSIVSGEPMTHAQLKRMKAFFDNNAQGADGEKAKGKTVNDSAILQSWNLWGGDAGRRWVEQNINQAHSKNDTSKTVRNASGLRTKTLMDPHNTRIRR